MNHPRKISVHANAQSVTHRFLLQALSFPVNDFSGYRPHQSGSAPNLCRKGLTITDATSFPDNRSSILQITSLHEMSRCYYLSDGEERLTPSKLKASPVPPRASLELGGLDPSREIATCSTSGPLIGIGMKG